MAAEIQVGTQYLAKRTDRNRLNGIQPDADCRITHVGPTGISIEVVGGNNGRDRNLFVPRDAFGGNFETGPSPVANRAYARQSHFTEKYR